MKELLESGLLVDIAIGALALEAIALVVLRGRIALAPLDVFGQLIAGGLLLLAVRFAVTGEDYRLVLLMLALSFPAHLYDLRRRARK